MKKDYRAAHRHACSQGIKGFFKYLILENVIQDNPATLLESPRIGRKLPDTLSIEEIDSIISAIDLSKPEGTR
jgi:integrase/recombinase XerD